MASTKPHIHKFTIDVPLGVQNDLQGEHCSGSQCLLLLWLPSTEPVTMLQRVWALRGGPSSWQVSAGRKGATKPTYRHVAGSY